MCGYGLVEACSVGLAWPGSDEMFVDVGLSGKRTDLIRWHKGCSGVLYRSG